VDHISTILYDSLNGVHTDRTYDGCLIKTAEFLTILMLYDPW